MQTHIIARTAVFNARGHVLLLTRSRDDDYRPGGFDLPGGRVEDGEEILGGALRELNEETGLRLEPQKMMLLFATGDIHYHTEVKADVNFVWLGFACSLPAAAHVKLSHEHTAYDWVAIDDAIRQAESTDQRAFLTHIRNHNVRTA